MAASASSADAPAFDYERAFGRTVGWIDQGEQDRLRHSTVAIAGLGGVGGAHLLTLVRLGVERFHIADDDALELVNFNRHVGASMRHVGRPKLEVMAELARAINPGVELEMFPTGIDEDNVGGFLDGADLYVDSLDLFAIDTRRLVFGRCADDGVPAITAAPLGMGMALLTFLPGKMTFERYFDLEGHDRREQLLRFIVGVSPAALQRAYLVVPSTFDIDARRAPSTPMGVELCAGVAATYALKILCGRGEILAAPWGLQFDAYRNRLRRTWRPGGNRNPLQRFTLFMARRQLLIRPAAPSLPEGE